MSPGIASEYPADLGLIELRPVLQPRPAKKASTDALDHGEYAVATLKPLVFNLSQAFLGLGPLVESPNEAGHFGIVVECDELIDIRHGKRTQEEAFGLQHHSGSLRHTAPACRPAARSPSLSLPRENSALAVEGGRGAKRAALNEKRRFAWKAAVRE